MRFKPTWMERKTEFKKVQPVIIDYGNSSQGIDHPLLKASQKSGITKSVFEIGSYRHNFSTKDQLTRDRQDYLRASSNFSLN